MKAWFTYRDTGRNKDFYEACGRESAKRLLGFGIQTVLVGDWLDIGATKYIKASPDNKGYYADSKLLAMSLIEPEDFLLDLDMILLEAPSFDGNTVLSVGAPFNAYLQESPTLTKLFPTAPKHIHCSGLVHLDKESWTLWEARLREIYSTLGITDTEQLWAEEHSLSLITDCKSYTKNYKHFFGPDKSIYDDQLRTLRGKPRLLRQRRPGPPPQS
jgi:hypothetical protein